MIIPYSQIEFPASYEQKQAAYIVANADRVPLQMMVVDSTIDKANDASETIPAVTDKCDEVAIA